MKKSNILGEALMLFPDTLPRMGKQKSCMSLEETLLLIRLLQIITAECASALAKAKYKITFLPYKGELQTVLRSSKDFHVGC